MNEAVVWVASHTADEMRQALDEAWSALRVLLAGLRVAAQQER